MANTRVCKILNVAEKNDAARELSNTMSGGRVSRREGVSKYNKIYEFDFNILGQNSHMIMTSVSGHLLNLDFISAYRNWNSCAPEVLFTADVHNYCPENSLPIKRTLEREIRGCQHLILWTDGDREGENIADEIVEVVTNVKSRGLSIHRARFSEITQRSVMNACRNLGVLDQRVSDAVKVRRELDLRIGSAFTRFQTKFLTKAFPLVLSEQLISYGPCQFPTLGFVVERFKQIQAFVAETFYKIKVTHEVREEKVDFTWHRGRVFHHTVCLVLYQLCLQDPIANVLGTTNRPRSKWRPLPLDTVELEKLASRKLKIRAKETMRIAEKLYTQGFMSYPRTETNIFPDSFDLGDVIQLQAGDPQWGDFASRLAAVGATPRQGTKTDNAHPPIYPTKYTNSLIGDEKRIYELVTRHFLACCSKDAKGQETKVEIAIAGEKFTAQGLVILERNYLEVYPYDKWTAKTIPAYETGSSFQPTSIEMVDGETTPPPLLQEADLIGLMEKHGIGTDATHAEHIETIKTRNYVGVQSDGGFIPGELGMGLVDGYDSMGYELSKPKLRAELETDLKRVCEGTKSKEDVLSETIRKYKDVFLNAKLQAHCLKESLSTFFGPSESVTEEESTPTLGEVVRKCPHCQKFNIVIKTKRYGGYMLSCLGYPDCRAVQFFPKSVTEAKLHESLCLTCQPQPVHKLVLHFKEGSVPPYLGLEVVACTTCDPVLREDLDFPPIRLSTPSSSTTNTNTSNSSGSQGRGGTTTLRGSGIGRGSRGGASSSRGTSGVGRGNRGGASSAMGTSGVGRDSRGGASSSTATNMGLSGFNFGRGSRGGASSSSGAGSSGSGFGRGMGGGTSDWTNDSYWRDDGGERTASTAGTSMATEPSNHNPTTCNCGEEAIILTVRREDSSNKGRQFYKCPHPKGSGCDFFLWADSATPSGHMTHHMTFSAPRGGQTARQPGGLSLPGTSSQQQTHMNWGAGRSNDFDDPIRGQFGGGASSRMGGARDKVVTVVCNCGNEAVLRTVQKEGPNKGKEFYTCSKPRDEQCRFFEWGDSVPSTNVRTTASGGVVPRRGRGGGRGRGACGADSGGGSDGSTRKRAPPTCSVCKEVGHTKRSCSLNK